MPNTRNTVWIRASADKAWEVVGDLESVVRWVSGVTTCQLEGSTRICNSGEIQEEISAYSPESRSYRFRHIRVPLPVKNSHGKFTVQSENGATVMLEWEFEAVDPAQETELARMVDGAAKQTLEMLRALVEGHA